MVRGCGREGVTGGVGAVAAVEGRAAPFLVGWCSGWGVVSGQARRSGLLARREVVDRGVAAVLSRAPGCAQSFERGRERRGPWPVGVELEAGASAVVDELPGGVQQPMADAFGFGGREFAVKADQFRPRQQVLGDQRELQPGLVVLEGVVGRLRMPVSLPARMLSSTRARPR